MLRKFLVILLCSPTLLFAQLLECASDQVYQQEIETNPSYKHHIEQSNSQILERQSLNDFYKSGEALYVVPIVIHVLHNGEAVGQGSNISDAQILSGIEQLNNAFRNTSNKGWDTNIQFELAKQDPNCAATTGINRVDASGLSGYSSDGLMLLSAGADEVALKALSKWSNEDYYNIWIVSEIDGNNGGAGFQGFAYFPGVTSDKDGIVVMHTAWGDHGTVNSWNNQGKTIIHEMGHALNLYHSFEGDDNGNACPPVSSGCGSGQGDCCSDIPSHIRSASDCNTGTNACNGRLNNYEIHNYMDYSSQDCQYLFSKKQVSRMRAALETQRVSLLNDLVLKNSTSFSIPVSSNCTPTTGALGLSNFYCGILNVNIGNTNYSSDYANIDGGYLDKSSSCVNGFYLTESEDNLLIVGVGGNTNYVKAWIDFDNNGIFDESTELVFDKTIGADKTGSELISIPSNSTFDTYLRLRVMVDLSPVTSSCSNPSYGQAEDYWVYITQSAPEGFPIAEFSADKTLVALGDNVVLTDESVNATSWQWNIDGPETKTSTNQNPTFSFSTLGTYEVELSATNISGTDIEIKKGYIVVKTSVGKEEIPQTKNYTIYPNPVTDQFTIEGEFESSLNYTIRILDTQSKLVHLSTFKPKQTNDKLTLDLNLPQGVYHVQVLSDKSTSMVSILSK